MKTFLLIVRILLLIAFVAGIIMVMIAGTVAKAKKFPKEQMTEHYKARFKIWGYLVCAIAVAILMILSLFN